MDDRHQHHLSSPSCASPAGVCSWRASCAGVARELGLDARLAARGDGLVPADELERLVENRNVLAAIIVVQCVLLGLDIILLAGLWTMLGSLVRASGYSSF